MASFRKLNKFSLLFSCILSFFSVNAVAQKSEVIHPEWSKNATIYEVNLRQFTNEGTFKAFEKHLPNLKNMGVDIIWFMPIHPIGELNRKGTLGSYYSVKDYKAVNPEFGTLDEFKDLVNKIHEMGMYVIIDWVANHTSWDNEWTKTNPDFYSKDSLGNFYAPVPDWHDVIDLNYENSEMRSAMIDALKFWVSECNIDGYRCDVAAMVPTEFWNESRQELDKTKKVFMLAEASETYLHEKAFDMTYNWQLKDIMNEIAQGKKNVNALDKRLKKEKQEYHPDAYRMNFTTNHDENTWNGTVFERLGNGAEAFMVLAATIEGMPLIYSGQEAGLNKRLDFFEKDTIEWKRHRFYDVIKKIFDLKKNNEALWNGISGGELVRIKTNDDKSIFAFIRQKNNNKVFALFNLSPNSVTVKINSDLINDKFKDLFNESEKEILSQYTAEMPGWSYKVFYK